jgi:L-malate glycosyltransferase
MHIALAGPIATADVAHLLHGQGVGLPRGYEGAPLMGVLIAALLERGHRVSAITLCRDMPLARQGRVVARGDGLTLTVCPMRPRAWPFNGRLPGRIVDLYAFERRQLEAALVEAAPDVVHAHWAAEFAWAALNSGRPHLVTSHDSPVRVARFQTDLRHGGYRWLRAAMAWHVLRRARAVTAVSPYMADEIAGMTRVPVTVVPNPVKPRAFALQRQAAPGRVRVLMVGHGFDRRKNAQVGLQAFAELARALPQAELVLVGHGFGPDEEAQRWWLAEPRPGRLRFAGALAHDAVLALMAESDLLLHPALEETFGVVIAEAMAIGLPVVAGAHSGAVPWVGGDAVSLVDVTDTEALRAAMQRLLTDPAAAAAAIERGRAQAGQRFSAAAVAESYEALYRRALAEQAQGLAPGAVGPQDGEELR